LTGVAILIGGEVNSEVSHEKAQKAQKKDE
jgi:hypothetical protein